MENETTGFIFDYDKFYSKEKKAEVILFLVFFLACGYFVIDGEFATPLMYIGLLYSCFKLIRQFAKRNVKRFLSFENGYMKLEWWGNSFHCNERFSVSDIQYINLVLTEVFIYKKIYLVIQVTSIDKTISIQLGDETKMHEFLSNACKYLGIRYELVNKRK